MHMFKAYLKALKESIYIKRKEFDVYHVVKASLTEEHIIIYGDFAESCSKDILEIKVSVFSQPAAILRLLVLMICRTIVL